MVDLQDLVNEIYSPIGDCPSLRHPFHAHHPSFGPRTSFQDAPSRIQQDAPLVDHPPDDRHAYTLSLLSALRSDAEEANDCGVSRPCRRACGSLSPESGSDLCEEGCGERPGVPTSL